jgi:hypothetical protein
MTSGPLAEVGKSGSPPIAPTSPSAIIHRSFIHHVCQKDRAMGDRALLGDLCFSLKWPETPQQLAGRLRAEEQPAAR